MNNKNKQVRIIIYLCFIMINFSSAQGIDNFPELFLNPPSSPDTIYGVGSGSGIPEALLNSVCNITTTIMTKVGFTHHTAENKFGNVSVNYESTQSMSTDPNIFICREKIIYKDNGKYYKIESKGIIND